MFGKKGKRLKIGKSDTWNWYSWEGVYVENTGGGLVWVRIENKRSRIQANIGSSWFMKTCCKWKNLLNWNSEWIFKWMDKGRYTVDGFHTIVLTDNNRDVIAWQHKKQKTGNFCIVYLIPIIFGSYILYILSWMRTMHKYCMQNL